MTPGYARYIALETAISIVINMAITIGFFLLVFRGVQHLTTHALLIDAIPQSFMIALMGTLVPAWLTRQRIHRGALHGKCRPLYSSRVATVAAILLFTVISAGVGLAIHTAVVVHWAPDGTSFRSALLFKSLYGALLAAAITPISLYHTLSSNR